MLKRIDAKAKIIPGHGPLATRAALKEMLRDVFFNNAFPLVDVTHDTGIKP